MASQLQARVLAKRALIQRLQRSKKRNKLQAAFTLIELLIVVVIIGILSGIGIPAFINQQNKAVAATNNSNAISVARACAAALASDETYTDPAITGVTVNCSLGGSVTADADSAKATAAVVTIGADGSVTQTTKSEAQ